VHARKQTNQSTPPRTQCSQILFCINTFPMKICSFTLWEVFEILNSIIGINAELTSYLMHYLCNLSGGVLSGDLSHIGLSRGCRQL
jgi:hypothetical protein